MKKQDYESPSSEIFNIEISGCLLSSSVQEPAQMHDVTIQTKEKAENSSAPVKGAKGENLLSLVLALMYFFQKLK